MRSFKSSYQTPPAPYRPGQKIRINGKTYTVVTSTATHTQLEGIRYAVSNWVITQLKKGLGDELTLSGEGELYSFRRITDGRSLSTRYDTSEIDKATGATTRRKSPEGRHPTGGDLGFFLGASQCLRLKGMLMFDFSGKQESLGSKLNCQN